MKTFSKLLILTLLAVGILTACQGAQTPQIAVEPTAVTSAATIEVPAKSESTEVPTEQPAEAYPVSEVTTVAPAYPVTEGKDHSTLLESYPLALEFAKEKWGEGVTLYAVPSTASMELNLGHPMNPFGWYFMFKTEGSPLEYYVYVDFGEVMGFTEAQQVVAEDTVLPNFHPLVALEELITPEEAIQVVTKSLGLEGEEENYTPMLDHPVEAPNPIYKIYDMRLVKSDTLVVYSVDAKTGELLE